MGFTLAEWVVATFGAIVLVLCAWFAYVFAVGVWG